MTDPLFSTGSRTFECPPAAENLLNSMRSIGYSFNTAIADVIDNSVAAGATEVSIWMEASPEKENYVVIKDNGRGMSKEVLIEAMRYAGTNPEETRSEKDLGRFGLGMKTASLSQCRNLTVLTKQDGVLLGAVWDLDHIAESKSWSLILLGEEDMRKVPGYQLLENEEHGTCVVWRNFDVFSTDEKTAAMSLNAKMQKAEDHLALCFHRFLLGKEAPRMAIRIGRREIRPKDPFFEFHVTSNNKSSSYINEDVIHLGEQEIRTKGYTLPLLKDLSEKDISLLGLANDKVSDNQGFFIYRCNRLISWGSWLGIVAKSNVTRLTRVKVDISNDLDALWSLDIKKSKAIPPKEIKDKLRSRMNTWIRPSYNKEAAHLDRIPKTASDREELWHITALENKKFCLNINMDSQLCQTLINMVEPRNQAFVRNFLKLLSESLPYNTLNRLFNQESRYESELSTSAKEDVLTQVLHQYLQSNELNAESSELLRLTPGYFDDRQLTRKTFTNLLNDQKND